jgi:glycosyltransferase involved in cell wall biosynthesis
VRVGFDASVASGQPGGTGTYAIQLVNALVALKPDWTFILYFRDDTQPNPLLTEPAAPNVSRVVVPGSPSSWRIQVKLPPQLQRDRIDLFHAPGPFVPLRWRGPKIVTIHDLNLYRQARNWMRPGTLLPWLDLAVQTPLSAHAARRIIVDSEDTLVDLRLLRVNPTNVRVIPLAPDPFFDATATEAEMAAAGALASGKPFVLFVGVLSPQKNLRGLLEAFARAGLAEQGVALVIAGKDTAGYAEVLRRDAQRLGIAEAITLPGYVSQSMLRGLYGRALGLVLPSHGEGFGLPLVEAMAAGTPILAANRQALPRVLGGGGSLFDPDDIDALASLLQRLWQDPAFRSDLCDRARSRRRHFSWQRTADATAHVYSEVTNA